MSVLCLSTDRRLRRLVRRTLHSGGRTVAFVDAASDLVGFAGEEGSAPDLLIVDARDEEPARLADHLAALPWRCRFLLLGPWERDAQVLTALFRSGGDNLIAIREGLESEELLVTCLKLTGEEIFGLDKYLAWGAKIHEVPVASYDEKREGIERVAQYAKEVGCRRAMAQRIDLVADELLMNALYDAPAQSPDHRVQLMERAVPGGGRVSDHTAVLRYACDGRFFAVSVSDSLGALERESIRRHLVRAHEEGGEGLHERLHAGLGLYFVVRTVSRIVINIAPGACTEVIGFFDLRGRMSQGYPIAQSFNIFAPAA